MVTINTSNSLLTSLSSDEQETESDSAGIENIFASMFSSIDEKANSSSKNPEGSNDDDVMLLMKEIKNSLVDTGIWGENSALGQNAEKIWSSNILKIYESYKSFIKEAFKIEEEPTIKFTVEIKSAVISPNHIGEAVKSKNSISSQITNLNDLTKYFGENSNDVTDDSFEEFSNVELQRVKSNVKQVQGMSENESNNKKEPSDKSNLTRPFGNNQSVQETIPELQLEKVKNLGLDSNLRKTTSKGSASAENTRSEFSSDLNSDIAKSKTSVKPALSESTSQNNQNNIEAHLKLLQKNWGKDLAKIIEKSIANGRDKIEISLDPQRLGKMHLTLSLSNNQTTISISTENAAASLILTGSEERLAQMFESSGLKLSNFQANSNNDNSNKNRSNSEKNSNTEAASVAEETGSESEQIKTSYFDSEGRKIVNLIA